MKSKVKNIKKSICDIAKLLYDKELTDLSGGNISIREGNKIFITARRSGLDYHWSIKEESIIVTDLCKIPISGKFENISRESASHYYIYHNFPNINAVIHGHPLFFMVFGAAHMDLPSVTEGTRGILGEQPITNIEESIPGSIEQAERIVSNYNHRQKIAPNAALICSIPYHGVFAAAPDLNHAFLYIEAANNCAKILIYRQIMFGNNPISDFSIHKRLTKKDINSIDEPKEVCKTGFKYGDAFGNTTTYDIGQKDKYKGYKI